ncbi:MAG: RNA polymerase sigma factor [Clostridia bacterium]|nr:RNA polymerase sigma factor [Clostridia bacterium]
MTEFERLLAENLAPLQRFVNFKISNRHDAEDVVQDVCLVATQHFVGLKNKESFKPWLIGIAINKCKDYYRKKDKYSYIPIESLAESALTTGKYGLVEKSDIRETIDTLGEKEREIIYLYYFQELSQEEIAKKLSIPVGTVKSRLHYAKEKFKKHYPNSPISKGGNIMKKLPEFLPEYKIEKTNDEIFKVRSEELMGFCIVPKLGEKITWASYDIPSRKQVEYTVASVTGRAEVHGIEGVEIVAIQHDNNSKKKIERGFIAQLTDTHCRYLAESHYENGVRKIFTFLDSDAFVNNWGFGEDNCGYETNIAPNGSIKRCENNIEVNVDKETVDVVGRYKVTIGDKEYDTVCVMNVGHFNSRIAIEQYLDKNGRTILWRRFNKNDWAKHRYGKEWTELLPDNERLTINGETYVHWYDCITDYII